MVDETPTAAPFVPEGADLVGLREAAAGCRGCHLYEQANQTVFGEGAPSARVVLVGEQPGDVEDRQGRPFVGPAGRLLDRALAEAGIDRAEAYVTNAVKHFKFTMSAGKRRIHATPDTYEVAACRPWLMAELALLDPELVVVLGATAGKSLLGPSFRVTKSRGALLPWPGGDGDTLFDEDAATHSPFLLPTVHPSAILRTPEESRETAYGAFVADLRVAATALAS